MQAPGLIRAVFALSAVATIAAALPGAAHAQARGLQLSLGIEQRTIHSHFYDYNSGNSYNTWEDYSLLGAKAELAVKVWSAGNTSIHGGVGAGLYNLGSYDYEVRISKGSGPSGGVGYEVDLMAQGSVAVTPNFTFLGRVGASYFGLSASGSTTLPAPYTEDFTAGYPDVFVAGGAQFDLAPKVFAAGLVRITAADLGSWVDYGSDPGSEELSSLGFRVMVGVKL